MQVFVAGRTLGAILLLLVVLAGCSGRRQFQRAQQLEQQGHYLEAALIYEQLIPHYSREPRTKSLLETRLGESLLRAGFPQESFNAFTEATELDSSNALAHLRIAQLYIAAKTPDRAYDHLVKVLDLQPNQAEAVAVLGAYYTSVGQVERAEQEFQRALVLEPGRQSVAIALADLYNTGGEVDEARQVLLKSAQADKSDASAWLALGRLEEEQGNGAAAENAYQSAVRAEDVPETNLRLAQFLLRDGKVQPAEDALRHADSKKPLQSTWLADFELNSGHAVRASVQYASVLQNRLAVRQQTDAVETAAIVSRMVEADLDAALRLPEMGKAGGNEAQGPTSLAHIHLDEYRARLDSTTVKILEAEIALVEGDLGKATLMAGSAVAGNPDSAAAHFIQGEVYKSKGDEAAAAQEWNEAISHDPHYTPALLALARFEYQRKQFNAGEQQVAAVVRSEPANLEALLLYAAILTGKNDYLAAQSIVRRALAVAPQSAQPRVAQAQLEMKQGRSALALIHFQQAILLDPHSQEAIDGLISVYRLGKVTREMIAQLDRLAAAPPRSSALMEIAGRLYGEHHLYADAARCLRESLEIDRQRTTAALALAENVLAESGNEALDKLAPLATSLGGSAGALLDAVQAQEHKQPEVAIAQYEAAIRRGEYTGVAANNLAWLYAEQRRNLDRALELARFAHDRDPKNAAIMDTLGFVHLARREYSQAVMVLQDAITLAGHEGTADETRESLRQHLAQAYLDAGEQKN
jgi:tetratricopeptide (TPR) repeat protein